MFENQLHQVVKKGKQNEVMIVKGDLVAASATSMLQTTNQKSPTAVERNLRK